MHWTTVVNLLRDDHNKRKILMGSITAWNLWKIRLAFKNLLAALHNQIEIFDIFIDAAFSESACVIIDSTSDLVLKVAKLTWNFHPYIWNQTSERFGLQGLTSRAVCYLFIVNVVQQVEEGIKLLVLRQISTRKEPLKTAAARGVLVFAKRTTVLCLDIANHGIFSREVVWALNLAWKLFNSCCIQPVIFLRSQLDGVEVPRIVQLKAKQLDFPVERIRIGSASEPRARYLKVFFCDYIVLNNQLLNILDNDQVLAIFCRELAHWKLFHVHIRAFFAVLEIVLGDLLLLACGTSEVASFYRVDPGAHIVVHISIMKYFVRSIVCSLIRSIANIVNSRLEITADECASQMLRTNSQAILAQGPRWGSIVDAWKKLASVDPENFQFFDESFAEFFHGQPTIPYRLSKTDRRLRFSPDVQDRSDSAMH